jgi:hypothetical protein
LRLHAKTCYYLRRLLKVPQPEIQDRALEEAI